MSKPAKTLKVNYLELELPDAAEEARINAGILADPDTVEVSDAQFKKMRGRPLGSTKTLVHIRLDNNEPITVSRVSRKRGN